MEHLQKSESFGAPLFEVFFCLFSRALRMTCPSRDALQRAALRSHLLTVRHFTHTLTRLRACSLLRYC